MTYPGIENDEAALAGLDQDMQAVIARRAEREAEFGKYIAVARIPWGTVLAAVPGDRIPISQVKRYKWDEIGLVAERESERGRAVLLETNTATTEELERWAAEAEGKAKDKAKPSPEPAVEKAEPKARASTAKSTDGAN